MNILLKGHINGFKIEHGFKKKRESVTHSQDSDRSRLNDQANLDFSEFDPIFRKSDFKQVRKNVNMVLLGEYSKVLGTK